MGWFFCHIKKPAGWPVWKERDEKRSSCVRHDCSQEVVQVRGGKRLVQSGAEANPHAFLVNRPVDTAGAEDGPDVWVNPFHLLKDLEPGHRIAVDYKVQNHDIERMACIPKFREGCESFGAVFNQCDAPRAVPKYHLVKTAHHVIVLHDQYFKSFVSHAALLCQMFNL